MERKALEPFINDIFKQGLIIIGISVGLSIISLILTVDITQSDIPFFREFIKALSNYAFFIGTISIFLGLVIATFKKPHFSNDSQSDEPKFKPVYKKKKQPIVSPSKKKKSNTEVPLFSRRELKLIFSGLISVVLGIAIWIIYTLSENLFR